MRTHIFLLAAALSAVLISCREPAQEVRYSALSDRLDFDPALWAYNSGKDRQALWETREYMMDDLLNNYLKRGMSRAEVVALLGEPFIEKGVHYTWKPFPLDTNRIAYQLHRDSLRVYVVYRNDSNIPVLRYNVGFTREGPNMFIVVLDGRGRVADVLTTVAISK